MASSLPYCIEASKGLSWNTVIHDRTSFYVQIYMGISRRVVQVAFLWYRLFQEMDNYEYPRGLTTASSATSKH